MQATDMPHKITWEENGILFKFTGTVDFKELYEAFGQFYGDQKSELAKYQLVDFSDLEKFDISNNVPKMFAAMDNVESSYVKNVKVAIVSTTPESDAVNRRYMESLAESGSSWRAAMFKDISSARAWIDT